MVIIKNNISLCLIILIRFNKIIKNNIDINIRIKPIKINKIIIIIINNNYQILKYINAHKLFLVSYYISNGLIIIIIKIKSVISIEIISIKIMSKKINNH
jgi:hypothetical protein